MNPAEELPTLAPTDDELGVYICKDADTIVAETSDDCEESDCVDCD